MKKDARVKDLLGDILGIREAEATNCYFLCGESLDIVVGCVCGASMDL